MPDENNRLILREDRIVETVLRLQRRISDRFPDSSLATLCGELLDVAKQASERSAWIGNPIRSIRVAGYLAAAVLVVSFFVFVDYELRTSESEEIGFIGLIQAVESGLNIIIFFAITIWFLISLETRIKRRRAIAALYVQRFDDSDAVAAVSEVEQLSTGLSRKIWQKIMILNQTSGNQFKNGAKGI